MNNPDEARVAVSREEHLRPTQCAEPRDSRCCQHLIAVGNAGFTVWRCSNCGSEEWL